MRAGRGERRERIRALARTFTIVVLAILAGGYGLGVMVSSDRTANESRRLEAVARLKQQQLESWLWERRADARALGQDRSVAEMVARGQRGDRTAGQWLRDRVSSIGQAFDYAQVTLINGRGEPVAGLPALPDAFTSRLRSLWQNGQPGEQTVWAAVAPDREELGFIAPLRDMPDVAVVLRVDPARAERVLDMVLKGAK